MLPANIVDYTAGDAAAASAIVVAHGLAHIAAVSSLSPIITAVQNRTETFSKATHDSSCAAVLIKQRAVPQLDG